jgi:hypothetical protein
MALADAGVRPRRAVRGGGDAMADSLFPWFCQYVVDGRNKSSHDRMSHRKRLSV